MRKTIHYLMLTTLLLTGASCASHYHLQSIQRSRMLVDNRYDKHPDAATAQWMVPYQAKVDSLMNPVVGRVGSYLYADRPESPLSNLLTDILVWSAKDYNETVDFAVYNIGGMRAALSAGPVTIGDVLEVAPFENKICFVTLTGEKVMELFSQIALQRGEGVSHGVELVITPDQKLKSALLNGQPIDPQRQYRIATIDYVAQGNDKMVAFQSSTDNHMPKEEENNVRFVIMKYLTQMDKQGVVVDSKVEGRIKVEE